MKRTMKKLVLAGLIVFLLGGSPGTVLGYNGAVYPASSQGLNLRERLRFTDIQGHWAGPAVIRQAALGVLDGRTAESFFPEAAATRLEALQALLYLRGLEREALRVAPPKDRTAAYLQVARQAGILTPREAAELSWTGGVRRQEMAAWLARTLGVAPTVGAQQVRSFRDWPEVDGEYLGYVEALLNLGYLQGVSPGILAPDRVLKRGELASLLDGAGGELLPSLGITPGRGQVVDREDYYIYGDGSREILYQIITAAGELIAFRGLEPQGRRVGAGILVVTREGRIGGAELLQVGDQIRYYLVRDEVLLIEVLDAPLLLLQGRIEDIDWSHGWLDLGTLQGRRSRFYLEPATEISLNGYPARVEQLFPGQEVDLEVQGNVITTLAAFLPEGEGGYITPGSRVRRGQIRYLQGDTLVLVRGGVEESYQLAPGTDIVRGGTRLRPGDLRTGDRVTLYFNDLEGDIPFRVQVEGERRLVRELYRGTITLVSPRSRDIILSQPASFNMLDWVPVSSPLRLELHPEVEIYAGGQELTPQELAGSYAGSEVYVAVMGGYGRQQAVRIVVKGGFAREYYGQIRRLDWVAGEIELDRDYLQYDPGTIFLWEDRIIDPYALERGQEVVILAAAPGTGPGQALVVSVEDVREPELDIHRGTLEAIGFNQLRLEEVSNLEDHRWRDWRRRATLRLQLNQDTLFWDNTGGPLTKEEFEEKRVQEDYEGSSVLVVSQGDETVALGIWPGGRSAGERVTVGRIKGIDRETGIITLERVKDWSDSQGEWRFYQGVIEIDAGEAVTVRGERGLSWEELRTGQRLYLIREGTKGRLILVE